MDDGTAVELAADSAQGKAFAAVADVLMSGLPPARPGSTLGRNSR